MIQDDEPVKLHLGRHDPEPLSIVCRVCGIEKEVTDNNFSPQRIRGDNGIVRHHRECRICRNKKNRESLLRNTTPEQRREYLRRYQQTY